MASFLTGIGGPGTWGEYEVPQFISSQNFQFGGFVQDNWKATDKLTLNLGLRYDLDLPRTERFNAMSYLDPDVASPLQVPGFSNLKGGLRFVDSNDRHNYGAGYRDFGPRFGFAYRATDKLVVRGGYGLFYSVSRRAAAGGGGSGWLGFAATTMLPHASTSKLLCSGNLIWWTHIMASAQPIGLWGTKKSPWPN